MPASNSPDEYVSSPRDQRSVPEEVESPAVLGDGAVPVDQLRVVAIGASAGGLAALERFFGTLPAKPGAAFVVIQHLSPAYPSHMQELLARHGRDVVDLQLSCFWMVDDDQRYCSRCAKCFRIALNLMATGIDPALLGIDARRAFTEPEPAWMGFPPLAVENMKEAAGRLPTRRAYRYLGEPGWLGRLRRRQTPALAGLESVRRAVEHADSRWVTRNRPEFERYIPESLRLRLSELFARTWPDVDDTDRSADLQAIREAADWIAAPLEAIPTTRPM